MLLENLNQKGGITTVDKTLETRMGIAQEVFDLLKNKNPNLLLEAYEGLFLIANHNELGGLTDGKTIFDTLLEREEKYKNLKEKYISDEFIMNYVGLNTLQDIKRLAQVLGLDEQEIIGYDYESLEENRFIIRFDLANGISKYQDFLIIFNGKYGKHRPSKTSKKQPADIKLKQQSFPYQKSA